MITAFIFASMAGLHAFARVIYAAPIRSAFGAVLTGARWDAPSRDHSHWDATRLFAQTKTGSNGRSERGRSDRAATTRTGARHGRRSRPSAIR